MAVSVSVIGGNKGTGYKSKITAGENSIISDEPLHLGGENLGLNPFELIASGLAACTLATLRSYINLKKWEIEDIQIEVVLETSLKETAHIKRAISFPGSPLEPDKILRLKQIAERCPVHKLLTRDIEILTDIV